VIRRDPHVEVTKHELVDPGGPKLGAAAPCRLEGPDIEPLRVSCADAGESVIRTAAVLQLGINLRAIIGGRSFDSLAEHVRARIGRFVPDRTDLAFLGGAA